MMTPHVRAIGCALLLTCSSVQMDACAKSFITSGDLSRIMEPYLKVDEADRRKLVPKSLELGKTVIPMPALFVFFSPDGCVTAAVELKQISANDDQCMRGEGLSNRNAFAAASGLSGVELEGKPVLFVLSAAYDLDYLRPKITAAHSDKLSADREQLDAFVPNWQEQNPETLVRQIPIRFQ